MENQEIFDITECVICHEDSFQIVLRGVCECCVERIIEKMLDDAQYARENGDVKTLAKIMHATVEDYLDIFLKEQKS
jgi:hypothetical protein